MSLCRQFMSFIRRITTLWSFLTATALHISGKLLCTSTWCNSPPHILPRGGGGGGVMSVWDKSTHAGPLNRLCTESRYLPFLIQFLLLNFHNWFIGSVKWSTLYVTTGELFLQSFHWAYSLFKHGWYYIRVHSLQEIPVLMYCTCTFPSRLPTNWVRNIYMYMYVQNMLFNQAQTTRTHPIKEIMHFNREPWQTENCINIELGHHTAMFVTDAYGHHFAVTFSI